MSDRSGSVLVGDTAQLTQILGHILLLHIMRSVDSADYPFVTQARKVSSQAHSYSVYEAPGF